VRREREKWLAKRLAVDAPTTLRRSGISPASSSCVGQGRSLCLLVVLGELKNPDYVTGCS